MSDITLNSSYTLQNVVSLNGVHTTVTSCSVRLYDPNHRLVVGPVDPTAVSTGVYRYTLGPNTLNIAGTWSHQWVVASNASTAATVYATFMVGDFT